MTLYVLAASSQQPAASSQHPIQPLGAIHQTDNMRLISFAMVSFLAITVSAWPPHNPDTHDMNQPPDAATQDTEQFQDMQELLDGFFQNLQQSQNAATQSSQQSQA
ncbi:hypothetical protein BASA83_010467 [Batrachochytrium salamandrivorans]|nr:hypothetical protein BASA83_010467 [Batrachochytrium salamandrivorans]